MIDWGAITRTWALASKEVAHIRRDPRTAVLALGMPVLLLIVFGYGVSFDLDRVPVGVIDQDRTQASRQLIRRALSSEDLRSVPAPRSPEEVDVWFRRGRGRAVVVLPPGFAERQVRRDARVQVLIDGTDGNTANQTLSKISSALEAAGRWLDPTGALRDARRATPVLEVRSLFNPESKSALFLVPGLAAYVVAIICVLLTSLTVAKEWELGSMEQLFATPVRRFEIVLGKLLPYLGLGLGAVVLVLGAGAAIFGVPFRGSGAAVVVGSILFVSGMLAQGLVISVVAKNQMVATQAAALSSMLPSMLLSGFLFPIENMPAVLQAITAAVPARYYIDVLRGALLRGNGFVDLWEPMVALGIFAALLTALSTARFQRRLA